MSQPDPTDLHERLRQDASGQVRAVLVTQLRQMHAECKAAQRRPCDRETFTQLQAATVAVAASIRIIESLAPKSSQGNVAISRVTHW